MMNRSRKRSIVYAVRDYPLGCGTHDLVAAPRPYAPTCLIQEPEFQNSARHVLVAAPKPKGTFLKQEPAFRNSLHDRVLADPKVKGTCSTQEASFRSSVHDCAVAAHTPKGTSLKQEPAFRNSHHDRAAVASKLKGTCLKQDPEVKSSVHDCDVAASTGTSLKQESTFRNSYNDHVVDATKLKGTFSKQEDAFRSSHQHDPTPREQVLEVLRLFKEVFIQLDRDKQARRLEGDLFDATARIDIRTLAVLEKMGKQVNTEKRIGLVPGINVGDEFQYKTELRLVGLHFKTMCGIDYMTVGDVKLATSIVASEGYGYSDEFGAGVVVYTGEGGNVVSKEKKTEDQRLVKGNLALANSMRKRSLVRVIRGEERLDHKGKRYVYDGLYLVDKYWLEREVRGTTVYKFKLCRVPGQRSLT